MEMARGEKCVSSQSNSYSEMNFLSGGKGGGAFKERMNSGGGKSSECVMLSRSASARRLYVGVR